LNEHSFNLFSGTGAVKAPVFSRILGISFRLTAIFRPGTDAILLDPEKEDPMAAKVKPVPDGYHTATPYLSINGAAKALEFYRKAFGAEELLRMPMPDGKVGHAEIQIGSSRIMLADEFPNMPEAVAKSPKSLGGTSFGICLYVPEVDAAFQRAVDAGATVKRPVQEQFYGDRSGVIEDPFGHIWTIASHVEDVSPEEMQKRMAAMPGI
jgi:PhnB protein